MGNQHLSVNYLTIKFSSLKPPAVSCVMLARASLPSPQIYTCYDARKLATFHLEEEKNSLISGAIVNNLKSDVSLSQWKTIKWLLIFNTKPAIATVF